MPGTLCAICPGCNGIILRNKRRILMKRKLFLFIFVVIAMSNIYAQSKDDDIRTLFKVAGTYAGFSSFWADSYLPAIEKVCPKAPLTFWEKIKNDFYLPCETAMMVKLYDKYYTKSEIEQLIKFYKSPIGQMFVKAQLQISKDASKQGAEFGKTLGKRIAEELKKEGYYNNQ
jgi:hypothetical protein